MWFRRAALLLTLLSSACGWVPADEQVLTKFFEQSRLFDTTRDEVVWLTSSWSCATHTGALGEHTSCFQLCAYDDYCAKQVSCSAPDIDLLLCAMGVCIPEPRVGIR